MADTFANATVSLNGPAVNAFAVTPHDTNELTAHTRGIYVGVSGDVKVTTTGGDTVTFVDMAAGVIHPIRAKIIFSTGTDATNIIGLY